MKRYDTVIYDLDGTLLNTLTDLAVSINHALRVKGFEERTMEEVRCFVGSGARVLAQLAAPEGSSEQDVDEVLANFHAYYSAHSAVLTTPYPGIFDMLAELKAAGIKQAVVSNKPNAQVESLCAQYFSDDITLAVGDREGVRRKPAPDAVWEVMEQLGAVKERTLYVGDSDVDVQTSRNAGVDCATVTWGFRTEEELRQAGADRFFCTAEELKNWILNA